MNIIGLTGGSGAGKSTVAHFFAARGAGWVDADAVYHRLCRENRAMLAELSAAFGDVLGGGRYAGPFTACADRIFGP